MKILLVHNSYKESGGEDAVVAAERSMLELHGHEVGLYTVSNLRIGPLNRIAVLSRVVYSKQAREGFREELLRFRPDVVHVHNFFPLLSPSIYDPCIEARVPVLQTLHNFRTVCPGALLMRDGKICEKCVTGSPYRAVLHRCYRNSWIGSLAVARMVYFHRRHLTWQHKVDLFIALTQFSKARMVEAGFPAEKIVVKPNFVQVEDTALTTVNREGALYVGRLSPEKGIHTLLSAWDNLSSTLRVVGAGPLLEPLQSRYCRNGNVTFLGLQSRGDVSAEMARASFLVMPSECYETFGLVIIEAFAHGLPVVASRLGSMAEIVEDGTTGMLFDPGNAEDLAAKVSWMQAHPQECRQMGHNARRVFEAKYTRGRNYEMLIQIYREARENRKKKGQ